MEIDTLRNELNSDDDESDESDFLNDLGGDSNASESDTTCTDSSDDDDDDEADEEDNDYRDSKRPRSAALHSKQTKTTAPIRSSNRLSLQSTKSTSIAETSDEAAFGNAVVTYLKERAASTQAANSKTAKRKRVNRQQAECITEDEVRKRLADAEAAAHKKRILQQEKKEITNANKLKKAEERIQKSLLKVQEAKQKYDDEKKAIAATQLKSQKAINKNNLVCYICEESMPSPTSKKAWLSCEDCGNWCCQECRPANFNNEDCIPKNYFCNVCALRK